MDLHIPITSLRGIGDKTAEKFAAAGIDSVESLLYYFPRDYEQFDQPVSGLGELADGRIMAVCGFLERPLALRYAGKFKITSGNIRCIDGTLHLVWFNMPYLKNSIRPYREYVFRGRIKRNGKTVTLQQPRVYAPEEYAGLESALQPVYRLSGGLTAGMLRKAVTQAMEMMDESSMPDYLPEKYREKYGLPGLRDAIRGIHFPKTLEGYRPARCRIAYDEFLLFILGIRRYRQLHAGKKNGYVLHRTELTDRVTESLPYSLTRAQQNVWEQVCNDMCSGEVMGRLVQGDVGSGKTVIAFLALVMAAGNGGQGALMVPTEVLAHQHFEAFTKMMKGAGLGIKAVLLTGSMGAAARRQAYEEIGSGKTQIIIGTHALIQEKVDFQRLMLCVVDEQHRFGVRQREALSCKGMDPHILAMSATPIPRTLAALLYGDMQVSVIDEMPAGRMPVKNCVVGPSYRPNAHAFIAKQAAMGHQTYVICPMIEESEELGLSSVESYAESLQQALPPEVKVGCLHGKMAPKEKNERMEAFVSGKIQVLVSTTVIEVGVNVPNATVMMIEDAQRFGLAQLHQLRGRVGRGNAQSYCIMMDTSGRKDTDPRLDVMNKSNDGFEIAKKDLELRGPGDLLGIRQSGEMGFSVADVFSDAAYLQYASETADAILREDAHLERPVHRLLCEKLTMYLARSPQNIYV